MLLTGGTPPGISADRGHRLDFNRRYGTFRVTCQGPGVPFNPSRPFDSQLPATGLPPCGYQYQTSSANQVTIHYNATWTVTGATGGGNLAPVDRSVTISVTVGEIQILNN